MNRPPEDVMNDDTLAGDVTGLLRRWRQGDKAALDGLVSVVYPDLRRVARARLRGERAWHSWHTTALVHEVYLRLVELDRLSVESRTHFVAFAARLMRQILVDHARRQKAEKRGGGGALIALDGVVAEASTAVVDVLDLDEALEALTRLEARLCRVVELKFFAGFTIAETAAALEVSTATVERDWAVAKAWLHDRLTSRARPGPARDGPEP
jgi:RNA polymerase sigma factor (TIGR02999 family)